MPFEVVDPPSLRFSIHLPSNVPECFHIELPPRHNIESEKTYAVASWVFAKTVFWTPTVAHVPVLIDSK